MTSSSKPTNAKTDSDRLSSTFRIAFIFAYRRHKKRLKRKTLKEMEEVIDSEKIKITYLAQALSSSCSSIHTTTPSPSLIESSVKPQDGITDSKGSPQALDPLVLTRTHPSISKKNSKAASFLPSIAPSSIHLDSLSNSSSSPSSASCSVSIVSLESSSSSLSSSSSCDHSYSSLSSSSSFSYTSSKSPSKSILSTPGSNPLFFIPPSHPVPILCQVVIPYIPMAVDELQLNMDDIISQTILFDDGWAFGINLNTNASGVFPINFTVPKKTNETHEVNMT